VKTEEAFLKTQLQALFLEALKYKTMVLEVLLRSVTTDTNVVEVDGNELV
jgi:hypothetical protein